MIKPTDVLGIDLMCMIRERGRARQGGRPEGREGSESEGREREEERVRKEG